MFVNKSLKLDCLFYILKTSFEVCQTLDLKLFIRKSIFNFKCMLILKVEEI